MTRICLRCGLAAMFGLLLALDAAADNTTSGTASSLMIGQPPVTAAISTTTPERWYRIVPLVVGRSYCVETATADSETTSLDTRVTVFRNDATTIVVQSDFAANEPFNNAVGDRACFINTFGNEILRIRVDSRPGFGGPTASSLSFILRVLESTLFSNWFFLGGDYVSFTLIRNATSTPVNATVNWRSLSTGGVLATTTVAIAGNGGVALSAGAFVPSPATNVSGNIEIVHDGSPEAIMATTTVLSGTTGLSFDTIFTQRRVW